MNITPISESAVVCSLQPPASLQQQRQLWAFANQLQSEQDIVEVVVGMNILRSSLIFMWILVRLFNAWNNIGQN